MYVRIWHQNKPLFEKTFKVLLDPFGGEFGAFWRCLSYLDPFHVYLDPFHVYYAHPDW